MTTQPRIKIRSRSVWRRLCTARVVRILVSNDDGIYRYRRAGQVASEFGTVRVVAPDVERSSASHAITSSRPLSCARRTSRG